MTDKLTLTGESLRDKPDPMTPSAEQPEDRMRRALDQLGSGSPKPRAPRQGMPAEAFGTRKHRFVQDGEVAVTHVQARRSRNSSAAEAVFAPRNDAMEEERGLRLRAERSAQEAQSALAALQTKLAHAEIALDEMRARAEAEAEAAGRLQAELQQRESRIAELQQSLDAAEAARQIRAETPAPRPLRAAPARKTSGKATRSVLQSQKAASDGEEPQPVKWWLPKQA